MQRESGDTLERINPTARDIEILNSLYRYGPLTTEHITELAFSNIKVERTRRNKSRDRLRKLYDHGYVDRDQLPRKDWEPKKPLIYFLGKKGAGLLADKRGISISDLRWKSSDSKIKPIALAHTIAVTDFMVTLELAVRGEQLEITRVINEKAFKRGGDAWKVKLPFETSTGATSEGYLEPDQYFALENSKGQKAHFFLEIDLNTETLEYSSTGDKTEKYKRRDISRKIRLYNSLHKTGTFNELYNANTFRVLFVTTSSERAKNMKAVADKSVDGANFYFTIFDFAKPDNLLFEDIWVVSNQDQPDSLL